MLSIERGIVLHNFPLRADGTNPFVDAVSAGLQAPNRSLAAIKEVLLDYYSRTCPSSAAAWLGLSEVRTNHELDSAKPSDVVMPWQPGTPTEWRRRRQRGVPKENLFAGQILGFEHGWHACGPVSDRKASVEAFRLQRLLRRIQRAGFRRNDAPGGDIDAFVLRAGKSERWWVQSGHHRAAVACALNIGTVPVKVLGIVDCIDVEKWPNVASGLFSPQIALTIHDRLVRGEIPEVAGQWRCATN
jgi:hypothetical protein